MKRKYIAIAMGMALTASSMGAYAEEAATDTEVAAAAEDSTEAEDGTEAADASDDSEENAGESAEENADKNADAGENGSAGDVQPGGDMMQNENQKMGEVTEIGEDSITIQEDGSEETTTISLTEETTYSKGGMGGQQPGGDGEMPGGGDNGAPEKPDGEAGDNGEAPEKPDGENGEVPEKPDGEAGDNGEVPEKPDGENSDSTESASAEDAGAEDAGDAADSESSDANNDTNGEAPEKPGGENGDNAGNGEKPDGEAPDGNGQMPGGETIELSDIAVGDKVMITLNDDGTAASISVMSDDMGGGQPGGGQPGGGSQQGVDSYDAVNTYEEDTTISGETIESTEADENAVLVDGDANVTISDTAINRNSDDSTGGDNSSFYGVGAAVLSTAGTTKVSDSTISTDAAGGAGIFAYKDAVTYVENTTITTQQDTAGGIHAAGGGTLYAWDLTVETNGESSAAIRSDRGGGTMVVDGGTYTSNGSGSPAVYCTADISINNSTLTANGSEGVCIEGLNTLRLFDCDLTSNMSDDERNDNTWSVIVYQSMSGDSEVGNGTYEMIGGTLTSGNGGVFYTTNTECTITLQDVAITASDDSEFFLQCTGNSNERGWGQTGSNGSDCLFTAISQEMNGDVIWDSISQLDYYMTEGSTLTGAIVDDETYAGEGGDGYCNVIIDDSSKWVVTGDSTVTTLQNAGTIVDADGNTVSIVGTDGTVYVEGDSEYTITTGSYETTADTSGASTAEAWDDFAVEQA